MSNATTPSIVETKFAMIVGRSARSGIDEVARRSVGPGRRQRPPRTATPAPAREERLDPPALDALRPVGRGLVRRRHESRPDAADVEELATQRRLSRHRSPRYAVVRVFGSCSRTPRIWVHR